MKNRLEELNKEVEIEIESIRDRIIAKRISAGYLPFSSYFISEIKNKIIAVNSGVDKVLGLEVEFIDRAQFGADLTVKIPKLLKELGPGRYIKEVLPVLISNIRKLPEEDVLSVDTKGIYVNLKLSDGFLFQSVLSAVGIGNKYGESDFGKKKSIVVDYSSPNVAKHLHAGHIRSTIIGEVLSNIYEATGYTVHRLNYINDWGGVGYLIEGYFRWAEKISTLEAGKQEQEDSILRRLNLLSFIYQMYRKGERVYKSEEVYNTLMPSDSDELASFYGDFASFLGFREKFLEFKQAADGRFEHLENGEKLELDLWKEMRAWSMEEFNKFYNLINIHQDYLVGESFYAKRGDRLIAEKVTAGEVVLFTDSLAEREIGLLTTRFEVGEITSTVFDKLKDEVIRDVGAYVVLLPGSKRMVVRKASGGTIYATRDLAGIEHRVATFNPEKMVYEVGEEQAGYFRDLFLAADVLNLTENKKVALTHAAHGLYVDAETGKKLSSREGVEGVISLIEKSIHYFRGKYETRAGAEKETSAPALVDNILSLSDEDKDANSVKLAVGSIAFNDIKQEKRFSLSLYKDAEKNIKMFEESGGAYVMYSLARARSILRKVGDGSLDDEIKKLNGDLKEDEIIIIKLISDFPRIILRAGNEDNPAVLAEFLLTLSNKYNGYYEKYRVLNASGAMEHPYMLSIHKAVILVLQKGLKLCHADPPEII
ncbi:MAG: arginine--tRNA ligase [Candidatus Vogelbacteria bacterium]|nr:arginine--tRNA ligase [Candidatus Vogelbacteria bacterium]